MEQLEGFKDFILGCDNITIFTTTTVARGLALEQLYICKSIYKRSLLSEYPLPIDEVIKIVDNQFPEVKLKELYSLFMKTKIKIEA